MYIDPECSNAACWRNTNAKLGSLCTHTVFIHLLIIYYGRRERCRLFVAMSIICVIINFFARSLSFRLLRHHHHDHHLILPWFVGIWLQKGVATTTVHKYIYTHIHMHWFASAHSICSTRKSTRCSVKTIAFAISDKITNILFFSRNTSIGLI